MFSSPQGDKVWTPPLSSGCLPGVTRDILLHEIHVPGFEIGEKTLLPAEVEQADDVFITSTTRALLPVLEIDGKKVGGKGVAQKALQAAFEKYVENYVAERRATVSRNKRCSSGMQNCPFNFPGEGKWMKGKSVVFTTLVILSTAGSWRKTPAERRGNGPDLSA